MVQGMDEQWQADLCDMQAFHQDNDGIKYLLTVIDVLSSSVSRVPEKLQTDDGTELQRDQASVVERFNRTFKGSMWRYFTHHETRRYLDILPDLVTNYNHSYHRSIRKAPAEVVTPGDAQEVWATLYPEAPWAEAITGEKETTTTREKKKKSPRFKVGDQVRLSKVKRTFTKGYLPNWTEEVFTIGQVYDHTTPTAYIFHEWDGDALGGRLYEPELQKVHVTETQHFKIDRVVKTRKRGGRDEY
ncbi:uncharacterized protein LOC116617271 [Nematostella vectensis]|uniref:uncharacterized protein LOC116617271 n=1 Tax=Nematostella vectensis TaxID=45351 RepID=UPI0020772A09|nr:uncharacterized protein LOC116617271 [Nematostella vectensis]